jgi:hypothetical protein
MPIINGMGCSQYTKEKQDNFRYILQGHLRIVKAALGKVATLRWACSRYHYYDITAGSGFLNGYPGSPLIFLEEAQRLGLSFEARFVEINEESAVALQKAIGDRVDARVYNGDNGMVINAWSIDLPMQQKKPIGLFYGDANGGISHIQAMQHVADVDAWKYMDILLYVGATYVKRFRRVGCINFDKRLDECLSSLNKKKWLVREPHGAHQWTFVLGTNYQGIGQFKKIGLHSMDSPQGQEIMDKLTYTKTELAEVTC